MGESRPGEGITSSPGVIIYPLFAAIFPIVSVLSSNAPDVPLSDVVIPILGVLGATTLMWLVLGLVLRDRHKRGLFLLGIILLFWSYGTVLDLIRGVLHYGAATSRLDILPFAALELSAVAGLFVYLRRTRSSLGGFTPFLNVACGIGVALAVGSTTYDYARSGTMSAFPLDRPAVSAAPDAELRDIVYIIADAYGRDDVLRDVYGYDNTDFVEALEDRGFYVARDSRANYNATRFSIPSSMNFDYVNGIADELGGNESPARLVQNSRLLDWFDAHNYRFVSFASGYAATEMHGADEYLAPPLQITEFQQILIAKTPLRSLTNRIRLRKEARHGPRFDVHDLHRTRVLFALQGLRDMKWTDEPEFVFAHIVSPHWPFVLDEFGDPVYPTIRYNLSADFPDWEKPTTQEFFDGYRKQLQGLNPMLLETIDAVRRTNPEAIIIVQGDHGPRRRWVLPDGEPWRPYALEELAILNAYYLPGIKAEQAVYPEISPVNTFRVILNAYFQENLPLLQDRSFIWVDLDREAHPVPPALLEGAPSLGLQARDSVASYVEDAVK